MGSMRWSLIWLGAAAGLSCFVGGRWNIPLAVWLAPIFWLRFTRAQKPLPGFIVGAVVGMVPAYVSLQGMIPLSSSEYLITIVVTGLISFLPFLADRLMAPRIPGFLATLVFPLAYTALEYLGALTNSFGTWGGLAYTQVTNLPLIQLVSVTGIWGITFLVGWCASVVNWAWEQGGEWSRIRRGVLLYAGLLGLVLLLGGARLALLPPAARTVRVATITSPLHDKIWTDLKAILLPNAGQPKGNWDTILADAAAVNDDLIKRSEQAAQAGAKIVFWSEAIGLVTKENEAAFIERGRELARRSQIYLGMSLWTFLHRDLSRTPQDKMVVNKVVLVEPSGNVAWEYLKTIPVPGVEEAITLKGDGTVRTVDTPYGRIGVVICFDADFPSLVRAAGQAGTDLLFVPGADWEEITPYHTQMASLRAVENGFTLVRAARSGMSAAVDYTGRVLASMDHFRTDDRTMLAHVPTRGTATLYPLVGDWLAWLSVVGFVGALAWVVVLRMRRVPALGQLTNPELKS